MTTLYELLRRKFKDNVALSKKKVEAEWVAMFINSKKEAAREVFDTFFTNDLLKKFAADDFRGARKYLTDKAAEMPSVYVPNLGQPKIIDSSEETRRRNSLYAPDIELPGSSVAELIFDYFLPKDIMMDYGLYSLLIVDEKKKELVIRPDVTRYLGLDKAGDNKKVSFNASGYNRILRELEALVAESQKAAKYFTELGVTVNNTLLFQCNQLGANKSFYLILQDKINESAAEGFSFTGSALYPTKGKTAAAVDEVAAQYRPLYPFFVLLESSRYALFEKYLAPTYLSVEKDNSLKLAAGAKEQLERDFSDWTHSFKGNSIAKKLEQYKTIRKGIEADGLTIQEFDQLTSGNYGYAARLLLCMDD